MPPAAASRPRTYARNGPLKRARQVSSPVSAAPPSPSSPPSRTRLTSPPTILEPSSSVIVPPASPSPSTSVAMTSETSVLQPSVALGANPPAAPSFSASRGKARLHSLGGLQPLAVQGTLKGFFTALPRPTRLPVASSSSSADRPAKRSRTSVSSSPSRSPPPFSPVGSAAATQLPAPSASLQQLLLAPLPSQLETCQTCAMTFTRTSPPDLAAHSAFHRSVERGIGWFRPDEVGPGEGVEILPGADIEWDQIGGSGKRERGTARAVRIHGIPPGKVGKKIKEVHALLNAHLSAPDLPPRVLAQTQTFLLLSASSPPTPRTTSTSAQRTFSTAAGHAGRSSMSGSSSSSGAGGGGKEFVIGACVVQRIESALRVLSRDEIQRHGAAAVAVAGVDGATLGGWPEERLICVEPTSRPLDAVGSFDEVDDGVFCDPTPIPTLLGVHRIHTSALFRRLSLGSALLSVACTHAIYGVTVSTTEGGLAFSQPTRSGRRLMRSWARASGSGEVRVFVEDEE